MNENLITPKVKLPFDIDIIKHKQEIDGKSTSSHAKMLTNDQVKIHIYPDIPEYDKDEVVLIFVSPNAVDVKGLLRGHRRFKLKENHGLERGNKIGTLLTRDLREIVAEDLTKEEDENDLTMDFTLDNLPIKKAIFIDSTWRQCRSIYKDSRINTLNTVIIQNRKTIFWRKQKGVPDWFLSTIEAIHQFLVEFHVHAWGISKHYYDNCLQDLKLVDFNWIPAQKIIDTRDSSEKETSLTPYDGQYDNLLFFYSFFYSLIHSLDDPNQCLRIYE